MKEWFPGPPYARGLERDLRRGLELYSCGRGYTRRRVSDICEAMRVFAEVTKSRVIAKGGERETESSARASYEDGLWRSILARIGTMIKYTQPAVLDINRAHLGRSTKLKNWFIWGLGTYKQLSKPREGIGRS
jgi:hypothetical protein